MMEPGWKVIPGEYVRRDSPTKKKLTKKMIKARRKKGRA